MLFKTMPKGPLMICNWKPCRFARYSAIKVRWSCEPHRSQCQRSRCHEPLQLGLVLLDNIICCQDQCLFTPPCPIRHGGPSLTQLELPGRGGSMTQGLHWLQQAGLMPPFGAPSCWNMLGSIRSTSGGAAKELLAGTKSNRSVRSSNSLIKFPSHLGSCPVPAWLSWAQSGIVSSSSFSQEFQLN